MTGLESATVGNHAVIRDKDMLCVSLVDELLGIISVLGTSTVVDNSDGC